MFELFEKYVEWARSFEVVKPASLVVLVITGFLIVPMRNLLINEMSDMVIMSWILAFLIGIAAFLTGMLIFLFLPFAMVIMVGISIFYAVWRWKP